MDMAAVTPASTADASIATPTPHCSTNREKRLSSRLPELRGDGCGMLEGRFEASDGAAPVENMTSIAGAVEQLEISTPAIETKLAQMFKQLHDASIELDINKLAPHLDLFSADAAAEGGNEEARVAALAALCVSAGLHPPPTTSDDLAT
jgi:hypothetical protein